MTAITPHRVVHDPQYQLLGKTVRVDEWDGKKIGTLLDAGLIYTSNNAPDDDYWFWWLVRVQGRCYVGLPGVANYHKISTKRATTLDLLDEEVRACIDSHGL